MLGANAWYVTNMFLSLRKAFFIYFLCQPIFKDINLIIVQSNAKSKCAIKKYVKSSYTLHVNHHTLCTNALQK